MLTQTEREKACQIGVNVARQRGYTLTGKAVIGREPTEQCRVVVVVAPVQRSLMASYVHIVLEIQHKESARILHTLNVHEETSEMVPGGTLFCLDCDEYHTYELVYEDDDEAEISSGHICEWIDFSFDQGDPNDSYSVDCTRGDTEWYESGFLLAGTAGWFCARHRATAYEEDIKAVKRARERAKTAQAKQQA